MSLIALPPLYAATRDGLQAVPAHMREAAFALGKTRIATIRRVLIPSVRSNIATGTTLGISRIVGDTAIVVIVLGETLRNEPLNSTPIVGFLRGTGSTLTSYVFDNSPAGEGKAADKAYAAAFVLLLFVLLLNCRSSGASAAQASALQRLRRGRWAMNPAAFEARMRPPPPDGARSIGFDKAAIHD